MFKVLYKLLPLIPNILLNINLIYSNIWFQHPSDILPKFSGTVTWPLSSHLVVFILMVTYLMLFFSVAQFDDSGRPYNSFYYTVKQNFYEKLHVRFTSYIFLESVL